MAVRIADYTMAFAHLSLIPMRAPNGTAVLFDFQIEFQTTLVFGSFFFPTQSLYPQVSTFAGNGTVPWSYPKFWDASVFLRVPGRTPATKAFDQSVAETLKPKGVEAFAINYGVMSTGALGMAAAGVASGFLVGSWRRKK